MSSSTRTTGGADEQPDAMPADGDQTGGESLVDDVETELAKQLDELEDLVRNHPLATVGIAAGVGLAAGLLLSTHWSRR
jgi:ElaB/YqjD/DUF883 family membrane-anchored ribosome-binding protein